MKAAERAPHVAFVFPYLGARTRLGVGPVELIPCAILGEVKVAEDWCAGAWPASTALNVSVTLSSRTWVYRQCNNDTGSAVSLVCGFIYDHSRPSGTSMTKRRPWRSRRWSPAS